MKKTLKVGISLILILIIGCFSFLTTASAADVADGVEITDNSDISDIIVGADGTEYKFITKSEDISMYADSETGLFVIVNQKGDKFFSTVENLEADEKSVRSAKNNLASQLVIEYAAEENFINTGSTYSLNTKKGSIDKEMVEVKEIKNGIRVNFSFKAPEFFIPVEYVLENGKLRASIIVKEIKESNDASIIKINLLPSFAAADANTQGYVFVPDGSGALINFNSNKDVNSYEADVYGAELSVKESDYKKAATETIRMPVFAVCHIGSKALMGNVILGDGASLITATVGNKEFGQNICSSSMRYRTITRDVYKSNSGRQTNMFRVSNSKYSLDKYTVEYSFLDAGNSDYTAVAKEYQKYLVSKGMGKNDNSDLINLNVYGALEVDANFLGFKYTKLKALTGYADTVKVLENLEKSGINDISFRYIGWQNDGIFNKKVLKKNKLIGELGGNSDWKKLQSYVEKNDITAVYDADLLQFRRGLFSKSTSTTFNKKAWQYEYMRSTYITKLSVDSWLLLKTEDIEKNANKYLKSLNKSVKNASLSTLTNLVYSDFKKGSDIYRSNYPEIIENVLKKYKDSGYSISGEYANAYTLPYLSKVYNAPTSSSGYAVFDRDVMFYQMVLKGYVSTTTAPRQAEVRTDSEYLKAVETGSAVLFNCMYKNEELIKERREETLYSSNYELWQDIALEQYKEYNSLYESLLGTTVRENYEISENVMMTVFSNGTKVAVNYSYTDAETPIGKVPARAFISQKGDAA